MPDGRRKGRERIYMLKRETVEVIPDAGGRFKISLHKSTETSFHISLQEQSTTIFDTKKATYRSSTKIHEQTYDHCYKKFYGNIINQFTIRKYLSTTILNKENNTRRNTSTATQIFFNACNKKAIYAYNESQRSSFTEIRIEMPRKTAAKIFFFNFMLFGQ